jgi:hypothetical protein
LSAHFDKHDKKPVFSIGCVNFCPGRLWIGVPDAHGHEGRAAFSGLSLSDSPDTQPVPGIGPNPGYSRFCAAQVRYRFAVACNG